jgi:hypothetical protein
MTLETTSLIIGFFLGFISGVFVAIYALKKHNVHCDKLFASLLSLMWMGMHGYGFLFNIDVPYIFDIAGVAATGHIIGIDIISSLSKFRK